MSGHSIYVDDLPRPGDARVVIRGEEAHHALRVKRVREGTPVTLFDGRGSLCRARVIGAAGRDLELAIQGRETAPPLTPAIELCTATPKGPRLDKMIDMVSQCGVALWRPLETAFGVVDPGAGKVERIRRIAIESAKQSERAWTMQIGPTVPFPRALEPGPGAALVLADMEGEPFRPTGGARIRVLIGPEGGLTDEERALAERAGARRISFGPCVLRIETAAVVAAAIIMHAEQGALGGYPSAATPVQRS